MKKFYAFVAAALMSVSLFAEAPAGLEAALAESYDVQNNVVLCVHFVGDATVCGDVYFVGSFSGWAESFDGCPKFREVNGFAGWYAAQAPFAEGFQGKPIHAKADGSFSWDYQTGDVNAWTQIGENAANITAGYDDEANVAFNAAGSYIYEVSYWKKHKTACTIVPKHNYTIILYAPVCEDTDYAPAVIGDFNGWSEGATMNADFDEDMNLIYTYTINDEEQHSFKFRQAGISDWSNQIQVMDTAGNWSDCGNIELPVVSGDTTLVIDYSSELYKWTLCGAAPLDTTPYPVIFMAELPAGAPAAVEVIGTFDGWSGTALEEIEGVWGVMLLDITAADEFKIREAGTWDNQITQR